MTRLTPAYIKEFISDPLADEIAAANEVKDQWGDWLRIVNANFHIGTVASGGASNTPHFAERGVAEAIALVQTREDNQAQKLIELQQEQEIVAAEMRQLNADRALLIRLISFASVKAPANGVIKIKTFRGAFVSKGQELAEIAVQEVI